MEVRKGYQLILLLLLNVIFLISKDWEITIYFCAVINILFWWNNRRYLKYSVEKWNLQNLIISLFKLSTIIYFIFIFRFLIDFNTMEGILLCGVFLMLEIQLLNDSTFPRWVLYLFFVFIFILKFNGFVNFLVGSIGFQFLLEIFYTEEFIDYIISENKYIQNIGFLIRIKERIKNTRGKIKTKLGLLTLAFVCLINVNDFLENIITTYFGEIDESVFLYYTNLLMFSLAITIAVVLDFILCSKKVAKFINKQSNNSSAEGILKEVFNYNIVKETNE